MNSHCPICRAVLCQIVEYAEPPHRVVRCVECGMVYVDPLPDSEKLTRHYNESYYAEWVSSQRKKRECMWARRLKIIEQWARPGALLDIGCGEGLFLEVAKKGGWQVDGTEVSEHAANFASQRLQQPIFCGELGQADLAPGSFDVVTLWHVLEHTTQPLDTLTAARRLVKPDGRLVLAVPNVNDRIMQTVYRLIKGRKPRLFSLGDKEIHLYHFSADTLKMLIELAGFECLSIHPDFGIVEPSKKLINFLAASIHRLTGAHCYNAIQVIAKPT